MSRRTALPGASELFRSTGGSDATSPGPVSAVETHLTTPVAEGSATAAPTARRASRAIRPAAERMPSGRERHEEKITIYCSVDELVDIESARLSLRAEHGLAVDRGRIVREAVAVVLADLEAKGESSILVRRLRES
jgi:hypothetical protein